MFGWRWTLPLSVPMVALPTLLEWRHLPRRWCAKALFDVLPLAGVYAVFYVFSRYPTIGRVVAGIITAAGELELYVSGHRKLRKVAAEAARDGGGSEPLRGSSSAGAGSATGPQDAD